MSDCATNLEMRLDLVSCEHSPWQSRLVLFEPPPRTGTSSRHAGRLEERASNIGHSAEQNDRIHYHVGP